MVERKVPLGKPLPLTDDQLDELAAVTAADIEKAKAFWQTYAPPKFKTLLDAQITDEEKRDASLDPD